jgi:hypothetical protein
VLLSFGLVLIATALLVLGLLVGDGLSLIYASIALSALAAVILFIAVRVAKPGEAPTGPAPLVPDREPEFATPEPPTTAEEPALPPATWQGPDAEWEGEWEDDEDPLEFPIADYDELTEDEILPLLPQLYVDELDVVEARERQGRARVAIINMLGELRSPAVDEDEWSPPGFPIAGYDALTVPDILAMLDDLDDDELMEVRDYEAANKRRRSLLAKFERRLGVDEPVTPAAPTARTAAAARPRVVKVAPLKRAPARVKKAAPVQKAAPKRSTKRT